MELSLVAGVTIGLESSHIDSDIVSCLIVL